jgi:flagella basal body P-ring formation protein FlgA
MSPGDKISESDINWLRVPATRVSQNIIDDTQNLIGFTPRRSLRPGELIRANDVEPPRLVEKGAIVSISYAFANMNLSARGRALENGALGETINVLNQRSHRTIQVEVTGINEARVGAAADPVQLSALN